MNLTLLAFLHIRCWRGRRGHGAEPGESQRHTGASSIVLHNQEEDSQKSHRHLSSSPFPRGIQNGGGCSTGIFSVTLYMYTIYLVRALLLYFLQVSEMATVELLVNMHCVACAQQLRKKILKLRGTWSTFSYYSSWLIHLLLHQQQNIRAKRPSKFQYQLNWFH